MRDFNTFGGNPVSCAIGTAVLDVLERDRLQESAAHVGGHLLERLRVMMDRHPLVGDVRGQGLYIGVVLVRDRASLEPADVEARIVAERMKEEGVMTYPNGTFENVLKPKPLMVATLDDADLIADTLDEVLVDRW
jgi:4-aminobutyrate aminotransferase-like enzyme